MTTIKTMLVFNNNDYDSIQTEISTDKGYGFNGGFDMDELGGTLSFSLPYLDIGNAAYNLQSELLKIQDILKKWTPIRLYYNSFNIDPGDILASEKDTRLHKVFEGVVDSIKLMKGKSGYSYSIQCVSTLPYVSNEFKLKFDSEVNIWNGANFFNNVIERIGCSRSVGSTNIFDSVSTNIIAQKVTELNTAISNSSSTKYIDLSTVYNNLSFEGETVEIKWGSSANIKEIFTTVNQDFGVKIHQNMDGSINIFDPLFYFNEYKTVSDSNEVYINQKATFLTEGIKTFIQQQNERAAELNIKQAWEYTIGDNIFEIDYGDLTSDIQCVKVIGNGDVGFAIDPTAILLKATELNRAETDEFIHNTLILHRQNITSKIDMELLAQNTLLEYSRNNIVNIKVPLNPVLQVGNFITIDDDDKYSGQLMVVKAFNYVIDKNDVSMDIQAYRSVLSTQPEKLIVDKTGITNVGMMNVRKDVEDGSFWNNFLD